MKTEKLLATLARYCAVTVLCLFAIGGVASLVQKFRDDAHNDHGAAFNASEAIKPEEYTLDLGVSSRSWNEWKDVYWSIGDGAEFAMRLKWDFGKEERDARFDEWSSFHISALSTDTCHIVLGEEWTIIQESETEYTLRKGDGK